MRMFSLFLIIFCSQFEAHAIRLKCFEDELSSKARIIFLSSTNTSPKIIAFEQTFSVPHPQEGLGYIFQKLKQSESSIYRFPMGIYTGVTTLLKGEIEETYRGTLVIEEQGQWSFSGFDYQYRGTYLLHGPHDLITGVDKSVLVPVLCRSEGGLEPPHLNLFL